MTGAKGRTAMTESRQDRLRRLDTIGCDLGDKRSELFVIRTDGKTKRFPSVATTREGFSEFFGGLPSAHVVLEAGTHSRWVSSQLEQLGHVVTVANPRKVKLISESNHKDDDIDAELLARLGRADVELLSPIKHRGDQVQADLAIAKARDALVRCRTLLVNQARGLTKSFGYRLPKCDAECFHRQTKEHVPEALQAALLPIYEALTAIAERIAAFDKQIERVAKTKYPDVEVVSQMKGVGVLTAYVFVLTLEDKKRFAHSRDVGPFLGLTPKKRKSGKSDPQLRITKAGDQFLRKLLVQSANYILGPLCREESDLRQWGQSIGGKESKTRKRKARVAVARKLATIMHRLWVTGEVYQPVGYRDTRRVAAKATA